MNLLENRRKLHLAEKGKQKTKQKKRGEGRKRNKYIQGSYPKSTEKEEIKVRETKTENLRVEFSNKLKKGKTGQTVQEAEGKPPTKYM